MSDVCHLLSAMSLRSGRSDGRHGHSAPAITSSVMHRRSDVIAMRYCGERATWQAGGEGVTRAAGVASISIAFGEADFGGPMATQPKQREHT